MATPCTSCLPVIVLNIALIGAFVGLLLAAAISDIRSMTIPNGVSIALAILYPAYVAVTGADWLDGLIAGAVVFAIGFVLFALNGLGGGDVKLLAASSLWAGTELLAPALFITALTGGLLCIALWLRRGGPIRIYQRLSGRQGNADIGAPVATGARSVVPYGVAILGGGAFIAFAQLLPLYRLAETVL